MPRVPWTHQNKIPMTQDIKKITFRITYHNFHFRDRFWRSDLKQAFENVTFAKHT